MAQTTLSKRRNQLRGELRMPIDVTPLSDVFAAEVTGADLNNWDDDEQFACIRKAFLDHGVIAIRDQRIDPTAQISFASRFLYIFSRLRGRKQNIILGIHFALCSFLFS